MGLEKRKNTEVDSESYPIVRDYLQGSRDQNNIFWAFSVTLGGFGFLLTGLSSFLKTKLLSLFYIERMLFIPQGIILMFYGTVGLSIGTFLLLTILWNVGFGYNEYNKNSGKIVLYRKGYPGVNREVFLEFEFREVKSVKMFIRDGLSPKRQLLLCLKDGREIPLIGNTALCPLSELESKALFLAYYLETVLESS
jgi:hypothetical protein